MPSESMPVLDKNRRHIRVGDIVVLAIGRFAGQRKGAVIRIEARPGNFPPASMLYIAGGSQWWSSSVTLSADADGRTEARDG